MLECERCGRMMELTAESSGPEGWMAREARARTMGQMMDVPRPRK